MAYKPQLTSSGPPAGSPKPASSGRMKPRRKLANYDLLLYNLWLRTRKKKQGAAPPPASRPPAASGSSTPNPLSVPPSGGGGSSPNARYARRRRYPY